jgi:hypothetical protein
MSASMAGAICSATHSSSRVDTGNAEVLDASPDRM